MVASIQFLVDLYGPRRRGCKRVVWTNGCFDLFHAGHCRLLQRAAELGDVLIVGVNSDRSVRQLKGRSRPINHEADRAEVVSSIKGVTAACIFDEDWPCEVLWALQPDVVVKGSGGGWRSPADMPETAIVNSYGGDVVIVQTSDRFSTSGMLERAETLRARSLCIH